MRRNAVVEAALAGEVRTQWNPAALAEEVLASQRRRMFLREVLAIGEKASWDFVTSDEAETHCLRDSFNYNEWCYADVLR